MDTEDCTVLDEVDTCLLFAHHSRNDLPLHDMPELQQNSTICALQFDIPSLLQYRQNLQLSRECLIQVADEFEAQVHHS